MRTVLLIDDDPGFRQLIADWLGCHGWTVLEAQDGEEGLRIARERRPPIVLCDLLMAPVNGFQVCRSLRASESTRHARIVVTTGRDFGSDRRAALEAGADEYLTKPIAPSAISALLSRLASGLDDARAQEHEPASDSPLRFRFWGVRGSVPTPGPTTLEFGGNTSCIEVRVGKQILILDAGTGLRMLGRELLKEFGDQPLDLDLLLTHTHWDHIQGLPFFLPVYKPNNHLRIYGYEGARHGLDDILTNQMANPFFPVGLREVPGNITIDELQNLQFNIGQIQVQATFANHPGICVGYRLSASGRSIAYFPDNELRHTNHPSSNGDSPLPSSADFAHREKEKLAAFLRGTDVLIMDSQYDAQEYEQHLGWGHGCSEDVVALAIQAGVGHLFLFHHDPDHSDEKVRLMTEQAREQAAAQGSPLQIDAAREGLTVELQPARPPPGFCAPLMPA